MAEVLHGDGNANQLNAHANKAQVYGLKGNDTLTGDGKRDVLLVGGSGDDSLIMSGGNGTLAGGDGSDTFELTYSASKPLTAVIEDVEPARDKIVVNFDGDTAPQLTTTTGGNDVVLRDGSRLSVTLKGVRDNDYFDGDATEQAWKVLELTNAEREADGKSPLTMADGLTNAAQIRAKEITSLGTLGLLTDHRRPGEDGKPDDDKPYDTVFKEVGKTYRHYGENLDGGAATPQEVVAQWMSSESHKENILNAAYKKIGVGYNYDDPDPTNHRWYWTQLFGDSLTAQETVDVSSARPQVNAVSKILQGDDAPNTLSNSEYGATIDARGGDDSISNKGLLVSINGGDDNDTIDNGGSFSTITGDTGDDRISLNSAAQEILIQYAPNDGNDTISGIHATDTLSISGSEYTPAIVDGNIVIAAGTGSITLLDAAESKFNIDSKRSKLFIGTEGNDTYFDFVRNATVRALGGNDSVDNRGDEAFIDGGAGNDSIQNRGENVTVSGGAGNDSIQNEGSNSSIDGGAGDDSIFNDNILVTGYNEDGGVSYVRNVTINGGADNDSVLNYAASVSIDGGDGNDEITNRGSSVTLDGGNGNDSITNHVSSVTINGGNDNDLIVNDSGWYSSVNGGDGDDSINSNADYYVSIEGGTGNDSIQSTSSDSYIKGGSGKDTISNSGLIVTIDGGDDDDVIYSDSYWGGGSRVTALGGAGNDSINNKAPNASIDGGTGSDTIENHGFNSTISGGEGDDYISNEFDFAYSLASPFSDVMIDGGEGKDTIQSSGVKVTVAGGAGDDSIVNSGGSNSINGGEGNDSIENSNDLVTIAGGAGNDYIQLVYYQNTARYTSRNILIEYSAGDGDDTIEGFNASDTLNISGGEYFRSTVGNDVVLTVGAKRITLKDAASLSAVNITGQETADDGNKHITLDEDTDTYRNTSDGATIAALGVKVSITNEGANVSIKGGEGDDTVADSGSDVTIDGGRGDDQIDFAADAMNNLIQYSAGDGNDTVSGFNESDALAISNVTGNYSTQTSGSDVLVKVGTGSISLLDAATLSAVNIGVDWGEENRANKFVTLTESNDTYSNIDYDATIQALGGKDSIKNCVSNVSINAGADDDYIYNEYAYAYSLGGSAENVTIDAGTGNDTISNQVGYNVIINAGAGNDLISGNGDSVTIDAGTGNDYVNTAGQYTSIDGGDDNDTVTSYAVSNITIAVGAGDDSVYNVSKDASINGGDDNDYICNEYRYDYGRDTANSTITGGAGNDSLYNAKYDSVTLDGGEGNDFIQNGGYGYYNIWKSPDGGQNVSISGGNGDDTISNEASNVTLNAGAGDDSIYNAQYAQNVIIDSGDGNDDIINRASTVTIDSGLGDDSISSRGFSVSINGGEGNDSIYSNGYGATINGGAGDDTISGSGSASISIDAGAGNDIIDQTVDAEIAEINVKYSIGSGTINGGDGNDSINNGILEVSISGGTGNDSVYNYGLNATIDGGAGDDSVFNYNENVLINTGDGKDFVFNGGSTFIDGTEMSASLIGGIENTTINGGADNDTIHNWGSKVTIDAGTGDDSISNGIFEVSKGDGENITVTASIVGGDSVKIDGGDGNDNIDNGGSFVTIDAGKGDDKISLLSGTENNLIEYAAGDGHDTIWGYSANTTLNIAGAKYVPTTSGDDLVYIVGNGSITLKDARDKPLPIIIGESGTSGGGSDSGGDGGNSSGGNDGGGNSGGNDGGGNSGSGGQSGGNTSGGTSSNEGRGSAASGGRSASGSAGRGISSGTSSGGNGFRRNNHSTTTDAPTVTASTATTNPLAATSTTSTPATQHVYTGDNQVIADYTSGQRIVFGAQYTGAFFDGNGNFFAGSTTGALVVQNATDKVIDLTDAAGNSFVKAYAATNAGIIDGRGLAGFEMINGSAGADAIYAGDGGSQLWGGADNVSDAMTGGGGTDIFIGGRTQGADYFLNASSADVVHLNDSTLSDIVATAEENGTIGIAFNTGNVVAVQSSEALSATVMLADGSAYRFNHATRNWQTA